MQMYSFVYDRSAASFSSYIAPAHRRIRFGLLPTMDLSNVETLALVRGKNGKPLSGIASLGVCMCLSVYICLKAVYVLASWCKTECVCCKNTHRCTVTQTHTYTPKVIHSTQSPSAHIIHFRLLMAFFLRAVASGRRGLVGGWWLVSWAFAGNGKAGAQSSGWDECS